MNYIARVYFDSAMAEARMKLDEYIVERANLLRSPELGNVTIKEITK